MAKDAGPCCPACGYSIFGIRDMRCPECGRTLDVRDFDPDASCAGDAHTYERNTALGGLMGTGLVGLFFLAAVAAVAASFRTGFSRGTILLLVLTPLLGVWLIYMLSQTRTSLASWWRSWRKR